MTRCHCHIETTRQEQQRTLLLVINGAMFCIELTF